MKIKNTDFFIKIFIIIIIVCIICYIKKRNNRTVSNYEDLRVEHFDNFQNTYDFKQSKKIDEIHYLYWTGGFDSTFRLCEMLIDCGKKVQPIYVSLVLDNDCVTEETCTKLWLRRNRKEERLAMENIIKKIKENYPKLKENLLDLVEIDENINDDRFNYYFEKLFYSNNLWPKKRKKHQYLFLSKYAYYHKKKIDIGVLGIHEKSKLAKFLNKNLVKTDDNYIISKKNHPLYYINFPLFGRTKEQLLETAQKNGYDDILKLTWSCWFPDNGKPCKKCPMCKERILDHPNND